MSDLLHAVAGFVVLPGALVLAAAIAGSWLAIHAWGMFIFELTWTNWPLALAVALVLSGAWWLLVR